MRLLAGTPQRATERGTVLLMSSVTILIVVGMLALAVDVGYLMSGRGQLQNIVDASALAGAQGLRVVIDQAGSKSEQDAVIRKLAKDLALFNPMHRADGTSGLALTEGDVVVEYPPSYPVEPARVIVKHRLALPTIFGNVFGIASMNISAVAIASTTAVDGGTGFVSGCWRPILMPDTFYGADGQVWGICEPDPRFYSDGSKPCRATGPPNQDPTIAKQNGDRYVSRFASTGAGSIRDQNTNFTQAWPTGSAATGEPTSIRDATDLGELKYVNGVPTGRNLIGQRMRLRYSSTNPQQCDWRIINFAASNISGNFPADPIQQINSGCCTPIRVGQLVQVYDDPTGNHLGLYQNFIQQLQNYRNSLPLTDLPTVASQQYRYAQTQNYPTPNANPRVIPVLLCSPIQFSEAATPQFFVTNIAAFYIESVGADFLTGYFVREAVTAGTPLQPQDEVENRGLLPISVHLVR